MNQNPPCSRRHRSRPKVLIVDDEAYVCGLVSRFLGAEGYDCEQASSGEEAWDALQDGGFSLLIADIMMPGMSGMMLLKQARERFPDLAVMMVTAVDDRKTAIQALELGAYGYVIKPFDRNELVIAVANVLERRRLVLASREYEQRLEEDLRKRTADIRRREEEISLLLMSAAQHRDDETGAHIRRMGLYAEALAQGLGWPGHLCDDIRLAAPMHDIGKMGVPDRILLKPGKLTLEEFEVMKKHTLIGADILVGPDFSMVQMARDIALAHHEKWDGSGYPEGLAGESISECARLVAIADVYDALTHKRVYRPALPEGEAISLMVEGKGEHFDPKMFEGFLQALPDLAHIREELQDQGPLKREVSL